MNDDGSSGAISGMKPAGRPVWSQAADVRKLRAQAELCPEFAAMHVVMQRAVGMRKRET